MELEPYFCLSCRHEGVNKGIIQIITPCEKCGSLLIVPLASMHLLDIDALSQSLPELLLEDAEYRKLVGKRHLKLVPPMPVESTDEKVDEPENE
jgi:hypothetical protein